MSYVHPEYLVDTEWLAAHLNDPDVRIIESDEDPLLYPIGHFTRLAALTSTSMAALPCTTNDGSRQSNVTALP